jgi:phosphate transport system protein
MENTASKSAVTGQPKNLQNPEQDASRVYEAEVEEVRRKVLRMGGIVEEQVGSAVRALVSGSPDLAKEVIDNDGRVNALEIEIDEECTRIVGSRQPTAPELRLVMAVIKTINDLERIGDEAKRVGRMVVDQPDGAVRHEVRQELEFMGDLVREMLRMVLDAFARTDVDGAIRVLKADGKVDGRYVSITEQLITSMSEDPLSIPRIQNILWAARAIERMGDRCQNIAEYVFYLVHGLDIRHSSLDDVIAELADNQAD